MRLVSIAASSVNTTVGAFRANVDRAIAMASRMAADEVTIGVFQEQMIGGYPVEDLVQWRGFDARQWEGLLRFADATASLVMVSTVGVTVTHGGLHYNCAALVGGGAVLGLVPKGKLPTYSILYEGSAFRR